VIVSDWFSANGNGSPVDVVALFDSEAAGKLLGIVQAGALVSMGCTSDGGALGVTVTLDGRWRREYFRDSELLTDWLAGAADAVAGARVPTRTTGASSGPRKRSRGL